MNATTPHAATRSPVTTPGYAMNRAWSGPEHFERCPTLQRAWQDSRLTFERVAAALSDYDPDGRDVITLVAAGSLGRMEALAHSDCDLIVIVPDDIEVDSHRGRAIMHDVWSRLEPLELRLPKSWGIFVEPASAAGLTRPQSLGDLNESGKVFGKRLQCLLDSQPLFRADAFRTLQRRLLDWYATGFLAAAPDREWTYLLNDLIRYYRSYAAWQQFELKIEHDDSWYIRNAKLRASRLIMYAGMLLLLGESSRVDGRDKIDWLLDKLALTPLERVVWCLQQYNSDDINELLEAYEVFLAAMADADTRQALIDKAPRTLDDLPPPIIPEYEPIQASTARIMDILSRFVMARGDDWSRQFINYLLF